MQNPMIVCMGVRKTFQQRVVPISRLQDAILHRRKSHIMSICAVNDISLEVRAGEWLGIYGANGSGKTTFLKLITGLLAPDSGTIVTRGSLTSFFDLGIGFHPERTARENIAIHGLLLGIRHSDIEKIMNDIIKFADIGDHALLPMKCLSTGMAMRLAFAAAAHVESDIYIFDEVLAVGDVAFQERCLSYFAELRKKNKTVMMVSHNAEDLYKRCDRGITLENGRIKEGWEGGYGKNIV